MAAARLLRLGSGAFLVSHIDGAKVTVFCEHVNITRNIKRTHRNPSGGHRVTSSMAVSCAGAGAEVNESMRDRNGS